jgi:hypothetical protein
MKIFCKKYVKKSEQIRNEQLLTHNVSSRILSMGVISTVDPVTMIPISGFSKNQIKVDTENQSNKEFLESYDTYLKEHKLGKYSSSSSLFLHQSEQLNSIVLKFITWSDDACEASSFNVSTSGASMGRDALNEISVPSDRHLAPIGHSIIEYFKGRFYLLDNGYDYAASIRIGVGGAAAKWIVEDGCQFCAGSSVFRCLGLNEKNELHLHIIKGPLKNEHRFISKQSLSESTFGRSSQNTFFVPDEELSRKHFGLQFDHDLDKYVVQDCGSTNGTYVQLVGPYKGKYRLTLNDHIRMGRTVFSINRYDVGVSEEKGELGR